MMQKIKQAKEVLSRKRLRDADLDTASDALASLPKQQRYALTSPVIGRSLIKTEHISDMPLLGDDDQLVKLIYSLITANEVYRNFPIILASIEEFLGLKPNSLNRSRRKKIPLSSLAVPSEYFLRVLRKVVHSILESIRGAFSYSSDPEFKHVTSSQYFREFHNQAEGGLYLVLRLYMFFTSFSTPTGSLLDFSDFTPPSDLLDLAEYVKPSDRFSSRLDHSTEIFQHVLDSLVLSVHYFVPSQLRRLEKMMRRLLVSQVNHSHYERTLPPLIHAVHERLTFLVSYSTRQAYPLESLSQPNLPDAVLKNINQYL
jgi:hypothetical protein